LVFQRQSRVFAVIHKRRDNLFRHWLQGFGLGNLIVRMGGANPQTFEMQNVHFSVCAIAQQLLQ
jgi:hypothetical protein